MADRDLDDSIFVHKNEIGKFITKHKRTDRIIHGSHIGVPDSIGYIQLDFEELIDNISAQESHIKITSDFQEPFIVDVKIKYHVHCVNLANNNWMEEVGNSKEGKLLLSDDGLNQTCLTNALALINYEEDIVEIQNMESSEDGYLHIMLSDFIKADSFIYPNMTENVRKR